MTTCAIDIVNLVYRYAEHIDAGRLEDAAGLFEHARLRFSRDGDLQDSSGLLAQFRKSIKIHPCGTPLTKHLVTNPIVEIDEAASRAACRSYYTVLQATPKLPLQVIASGRYHDEFEYVNDQWRFSFRDYSLLDSAGEMREHMTPGQ